MSTYTNLSRGNFVRNGGGGDIAYIPLKINGNKIFNTSELFLCHFEVFSIFFRCFFCFFFYVLSFYILSFL